MFDWAVQCKLNNLDLGTGAGEAGVESAEHIGDDRAKQHENRNNNDSDQNKDQSVLHETLAFFFRGE